MFIEEVYRVSWGDKDRIEHRGNTYPVTPIIKRECKMITKIHSVLIGIGVIFAYLLAEALHSGSFFSDILMVVLVLTFLSVIMNYMAYFLIMKRVKKA